MSGLIFSQSNDKDIIWKKNIFNVSIYSVLYLEPQ
jgi:hypothetical protein